MVDQTAVDSPATPARKLVQPSCRNCGERLTGEYCAHCGQRNREVRRPFIVLTAELLHAVFELDGRAYRTLYLLLTHPAYLSREYVAGRRVSYTPPLRLFLVLSILLFFLVSLLGTLRSITSSGLLSEDERAERAAEIRQGLQEDEDVQGIRDFIVGIDMPFLSAESNDRLSTFLDAQIQENGAAIAEDPAGFFFDSLDYITLFILLMMPFMAVIQFLLYPLSGRYFIEHLILTVHNHSFLMLCFLLLLPLNLLDSISSSVVVATAGLLYTLLSAWIPAYLFLSLKRFFGQGFIFTFFKFSLATLCYSVVLALGTAFFFLLFFLFA